MQFKLFDSLSGGTQIGSTVTNLSVSVSNGIFSVNLDFGAAAFAAGADRYLEIAVHKPSDPPGFSVLSPRQQIASSPYSVRTVSASTADSLTAACVSCVVDAQINSVSGIKVTGAVANATTAANVSGVVPIANGGTGSSTKNFVDLSTAQTNIAGNKTFTGTVTIGSLNTVFGQSASTVYSTGALSLATVTGSFVLIPGLTQTINVPANSQLYISSGGGIQTSSAVAAGFSRVDIVLFIDGAITSAGNYRRVIAANNTGMGSNIENWHMSSAVTLPAGSHTIQVQATLNSGAAATVSGDATSVLQGDLTVVVVKN
jgi:hypothetical protein